MTLSVRRGAGMSRTRGAWPAASGSPLASAFFALMERRAYACERSRWNRIWASNRRFDHEGARTQAGRQRDRGLGQGGVEGSGHRQEGRRKGSIGRPEGRGPDALGGEEGDGQGPRSGPESGRGRGG